MKCLFRVLKGSIKQAIPAQMRMCSGGIKQSLCYCTAASEHLPLGEMPTPTPVPTPTLVHTTVLAIPLARDQINLLLGTTSQNLLFYCKIFFFLQYVAIPCTPKQTAVCGIKTAKDLVVPQQRLQVGRI